MTTSWLEYAAIAAVVVTLTAAVTRLPQYQRLESDAVTRCQAAESASMEAESSFSSVTAPYENTFLDSSYKDKYILTDSGRDDMTMLLTVSSLPAMPVSCVSGMTPYDASSLAAEWECWLRNAQLQETQFRKLAEAVDVSHEERIAQVDAAIDDYESSLAKLEACYEKRGLADQMVAVTDSKRANLGLLRHAQSVGYDPGRIGDDEAAALRFVDLDCADLHDQIEIWSH